MTPDLGGSRGLTITPRMSRPARLTVIAVAVVVILLLIDTAAWWLVTSRMMAEAAAWQQARIAAGYRVTAGPPTRAGWPLRGELAVPGVTIATDAPGAQEAAWQTTEARLVYTPWRPNQVTIVLNGPQTLRFGTAPPVTLQVQNLDLVVPLDELGAAGGLVATARHIQLPLPGGSLDIDAVWLRLSPTDMRVSLSAIRLPVPAGPLGITINSLEVQASSTVTLPPQRDPAVAATAWRDAGGQLLVNEFVLSWGPLDVHGTGKFGLDTTLQPNGSGALRITGYAQAIEALVRSGAVTQNNARVATTLLGLVSHPGSGGVPQADLPFTLRDGLLSTGAVPVMRVPRLALP